MDSGGGAGGARWLSVALATLLRTVKRPFTQLSPLLTGETRKTAPETRADHHAAPHRTNVDRGFKKQSAPGSQTRGGFIGVANGT